MNASNLLTEKVKNPNAIKIFRDLKSKTLYPRHWQFLKKRRITFFLRLYLLNKARVTSSMNRSKGKIASLPVFFQSLLQNIVLSMEWSSLGFGSVTCKNGVFCV